MGLTLVTEPNGEPVSLELLKNHLRITWDSEDDLLPIYVSAARQWAENRTKRKLISQTWDMTLAAFPTGDEQIHLPFGRCSAVEQITYYDVDGNEQTLTGPTSGSPAGTDYQEDLSSDRGGRISPPVSGSWPSVQTERLAPITVRFTVGYTNAAACPTPLRTGVLFRAADYYTFRGASDEGDGTHQAKLQIDDWRLVEG